MQFMTGFYATATGKFQISYARTQLYNDPGTIDYFAKWSYQDKFSAHVWMIFINLNVS